MTQNMNKLKEGDWVRVKKEIQDEDKDGIYPIARVVSIKKDKVEVDVHDHHTDFYILPLKILEKIEEKQNGREKI